MNVGVSVPNPFSVEIVTNLGPQGPQGDTGAAGPKGDTGPAGPAGADYVLTAADKQEIAGMVDVSGKMDEPATEGTAGQVLTTDGQGGRSWQTVQGGGGSGYPVKVFDYTYTGNWHHIKVESIDYSTGVLTLAENSAPFTDSFSTTIRVYPVPLFEGQEAPMQYGYMPPELWLAPLSSAYGVLVGTNQIKIYSNATTSIDTITDTGIVNLDRFEIWAEIGRNRVVASTTVTGLDPTHRYIAKRFNPYGILHFTVGLSIRKSTGAYGEGYQHGYVAKTMMNIRGQQEDANSLSVNAYETISGRSVHYGYTQALWCRCPTYNELDVKKLTDNTWMATGKYLFAAWGSNTPAANKKPAFESVSGEIYLNGAPVDFHANAGNANSILDGTHIEVWDMGVSG